MAKIPLRTYNREIENMIERGHTDEAIAHCKHILKYFPKHLDTYRLLGKAFLESQRYTEAADILERVLTAIPDDFIAHLGMSIIREDEGNLDAAIWHMERVFEVQPSNAAIQSELRRLYGRRDGIEPPKIRLTRGALVRMYAKGELFPQATAEIRAALAEDSKRVDLEAILANVYYRAGRKVEATEVCSRIVSKAPFSLEANRILSEILPTTSRADDAKIYQARLQSMDPYAAYISTEAPTSADVPDQSVLIERIDWQPSQESENQPAWTQAVGLQWEDSAQNTEPDWLIAAKESEAASSMISDSQLVVESQNENVLPDFLAGAGWAAAAGDATAIPDTQAYEEQSFSTEAAPDTDNLAEAEIPDWLAAMAPPKQAEAEPEETDRAEWLSSILDGKTETASLETAEQATAPGDSDIPDWLASQTSEPEISIEEPASKSDVPDWLSALGEEKSSPEILAPEAAGEEAPDWLAALASDGTPAETVEPAAKAEETPDWLAALTSDETPVQTVEPTVAADETPEWLAALTTDETPSETAEPTVAAEDTPEWLAALTSDETPAEVVEPTVTAEEAPDWLAALASDETPAEAEEPAIKVEETPEWLATLTSDETPAEVEEPAIKAEETPEWLAALTSDETPAEVVEPSVTAEETPEWLAALASDETISEVEEPAVKAEETPEWLSALTTEETATEVEVPTAEVEKITTDQQSAISQPASEQDIDSALAWLEGLAAKQGADSDFLFVAPEDRTEKPPEWVEDEITLAKTGPLNLSEVEPIVEEQLPTEAVIEQHVPVFDEPAIEEIAPEVAPVEVISPELEVPALSEVEAENIEPATSEISTTDELPDWLAGLGEPESEVPAISTAEVVEPIQEPVEVTPEIEVPIASIIEADQLPVIEEASVATPAGEMDIDSALAWLEGLAVKQGADSDFLFTTEGERPVDAPEWVNNPEETPVTESSPMVAEIEPEAIISETQFEEATGLTETTPELEIESSELDVLPEAVAENLVEAEAQQVESVAPANTGETEIDAALAWLEGLAAKQGADSDFLFVAPEDRTEKPPEWVEDEITMAKTGPLKLTEVESAIDEQLPTEKTEELPAVQVEAPILEEIVEDITLPEIAEAEVEITPLPEIPLEPVAEVITTPAVEELPDWLKVEAVESPVVEEKASVDEWLSSLASGTEQEPVTIEEPLAWVSEDKLEEEKPVEPIAQPSDNEITADPSSALELAKQAVLSGDVDTALAIYNTLIQENSHLEECIHDLRDALYRYPIDISIWQSLGDAYANANLLQEALDAYTKAEELLR